MLRGLLPCVTGLQGLASTSGSDDSPLVTQEISAQQEMASQSCGFIMAPSCGDKSSQDKDIRLAKDLARNL